MDVVILNQRRTIPVTSIVIGDDSRDPKKESLHMFFCPHCQNPMFQYKGRLISITPGSAPLELPILIKCRCGNVYQINDIL